jgi:putative DNA primase/helicase
VKILSNDKAWRDPVEPAQTLLAWDIFSSRVTALAPPPWGEDYRAGDLGLDNSWTDQDDSRAAAWLAQKWNCRCTSEVAGKAVELVAQRRPFHPVRAYLEGLPPWDKKPRVGRFFIVYLGAEDTPYHRDVGKWFLIAAIARVYEPGCKVDLVPILEGAQGRGKSSALFFLCPDERWFYDSDLELGSKDAYQNIRGRWLIELPELDSLSRVDERRIKAFFSSRVDTYRPSYGRRTIQAKRQQVFSGTTNQGKDHPYMRDETGGRRFFPVACEKIDVPGILKDRDQIWAEALELYRAGVLHYATTTEETERAKAEQEARYKVDAWEERFAEWLAGKTVKPQRLSLVEVLVECFKVEVGRQDDAAQKHAAKALRRAGWVRRRIRLRNADGKLTGELAWFYFPPGTTTPPDEEPTPQRPWDSDDPEPELPLGRMREPGEEG